MTTNRVATTTVQYQVNQSSIAAVQAANANVAASFATVADATAGMSADVLALNPQLATMAQVQTASANATTQNTNALARQGTQVQDLTALYAALDEQAKLTAADTAAVNAGGSGSNISAQQFGSRVAGIGSILGSAGGQGLRDASQIVQLGAVFGVVGAAAGVLAVGLKTVTENADKAAKAITESADAYYKAQAAAAEQTRAQLIQQRDQQMKALAAQQENYDEASRNLQAYIQSHPLLLIPNVPAGLDSVFSGLNQAYKDQKTTLETLQDALNATNIALVGTADDANTLAAQLAEATAASTQNILTRADAFASAEQLTNEERQKAIDKLNVEKSALETYRDTHGMTQESLDKLNAKIKDLNSQIEGMTGVTYSWADALADVQTRSDAVNNLFDANTKLGEAMQRTAQAEQAVADAASEHADKLREIQADEQAKETADRLAAAQQAEDDLQKHQQRLEQIEAQYNADHEAAVGNRDALANYRAMQKRDDDTKKENDAYTLQEQQLQKHLDQQLADDQAAARKQEAAENASYAKRNAQLITALNNAQVEQSRAAGLALAYQRQANDAQLNERIRHNAQIEVSQNSADTVAEMMATVHQNALANIAYAGGALVEQAFAGTMANLVRIVTTTFTPGNLFNPTVGQQAGVGYASPNYIQSIVNQSLLNLINEANR